MSDPISPISSPHGYFSHVKPQTQLVLTTPLENQLKTVTQRLDQMQQEAGYAYPNTSHLANDLQDLDVQVNSFLSEVNKSSNRGYENQVKEKILFIHTQFTKDLDMIKNSEGTSLRDVLYDPQKCEEFLNDLSKTPEGREKLQHIAPLAATFKEQVHASFALS